MNLEEIIQSVAAYLFFFFYNSWAFLEKPLLDAWLPRPALQWMGCDTVARLTNLALCQFP